MGFDLVPPAFTQDITKGCVLQHLPGDTAKGAPASRFRAGNVPPITPADELFRLEATTVFVSDAPPEEVGNAVLDFLSQDDDVVVSKVSPAKFSLKASSWSRLGACGFKVRVYTQCYT